MPIRFRCAFCNQLMGIARRKAGQVVRCPRCAGQVVVPAEPEAAPPAPQPANPSSPSASGGVFDQDDFSQVLGQGPSRLPLQQPPPSLGQPLEAAQDYDVEPIGGPVEIRGIFLTPGLLSLAGVLIIVLMGAAFFVGWMVGRW